MLVPWRGPTCLAEAIPQPAHPIGYAVARPKGRAFIRARRVAARSPFPRRSLRSLPPSPSRASPPAGKAYPRAGEGGALSAAAALRCAALADGATSASAAAIAARSHGALPPPCPRKPPAGGWARRWRASPHPTRQRRQSHKRAAMRRAPRAASAAPLVCASRPAPSSRPRLRAVPRRAPLAHQAACAAAASVASPRAAAGSLSRGSSGNLCGLLRLHRRPGSISLAFPGCCSPGPRGSRFCCIFSRSVLQTFVRYGTIVLVGFACCFEYHVALRGLF